MAFTPDRVINDKQIEWDKLRGSRILITGGTGLIGSVLARTLLYANRVNSTDIKITLVVRDTIKAKRIYGKRYSELTFIQQDLMTEKIIEGSYDYIIHCAAITSSSMMITSPVETIELSYRGTSALLKTARQNNVKGMVYISSMEVYGVTTEEMNPVTEDRLGIICLDNVRSSYQESKRLCELLCTSYAEEYGVNVVSARLAQTFGAGVDKSDGRVFAQFARSITEGRDIVLHTAGDSSGNYCDTADMASAVLILLTKGVRGQSYNVANENNSCTVKEMAELCAGTIAGGKIKVVYDIPEDNSFGYAPVTRLRLSSARLRSLGWDPQYSLSDMYLSMIDHWNDPEDD